MASGFPLMPLTIFGFPPIKSNDRTHFFEVIYETNSTVTLFESPHRIVNTLRAMAPNLGERPIMAARELTKVHQEFLRGTASELSALVSANPKGEFTLVIGPTTNFGRVSAPKTDDQIATEFGLITENGAASRRAAVSATAKRLGLSARDVYAAIERTRNR
jgi:16S rRNA (cytidine1402-2'-O)-methyltransferase